jgi:hypothetical protein
MRSMSAGSPGPAAASLAARRFAIATLTSKPALHAQHAPPNRHSSRRKDSKLQSHCSGLIKTCYPTSVQCRLTWHRDALQVGCAEAGTGLTVVGLKAGATPLRTVRQSGSEVAAESRLGVGTLAVNCHAWQHVHACQPTPRTGVFKLEEACIADVIISVHGSEQCHALAPGLPTQTDAAYGVPRSCGCRTASWACRSHLQAVSAHNSTQAHLHICTSA